MNLEHHRHQSLLLVDSHQSLFRIHLDKHQMNLEHHRHQSLRTHHLKLQLVVLETLMLGVQRG